MPKTFHILAALLGISIITEISEYMLAPVLPYLTDYFSSTAQRVSLTVSLPSIAYGIGLLAYGPLLDNFGRRPVLISGIIGFIVFTLACAFTVSINQLITARIFQGLTCAVEGVVVLAMISDMFEEEQGIKVMGFYWVIVAFASAVAPIFGDLTHSYFGWQYIFIFIALASVVSTCALFFYIPEKKHAENNSLKKVPIDNSHDANSTRHTHKPIVITIMYHLYRSHHRGVKRIYNMLSWHTKVYADVFSNPTFRVYSLYGSIYFAVLSAFLVGAPFVMIDYFDRSSTYYSVAQSIVVLAYIMGSIAAGVYATSPHLRYWLTLGTCCLVIGSMLALYLLIRQHLTPEAFILCCSLIMIGVGIIYAVVPIKGIKAIPKERSGAASALFGAIQMIGGAVSAFIVGTCYQQNPNALLSTIAVCALIATLMLWHHRTLLK